MLQSFAGRLSMKHVMLVRAVLAAALGLSALAAVAEAPPASLAGRWTLNPKLSDDVEAKALEAVGGGKTVGKAAEEVDRLELRKAILGMLPALATLEIDQSPTQVKLVDADDEVRIFYFGREHVREGRLGRKLRCSSEWKGVQLVVTEVADDAKLTEILTAVPSRRQILHVVRLEDKRLRAPLEVRLVYDAAEPPPAKKD
jgi:hypothetical protein